MVRVLAILLLNFSLSLSVIAGTAPSKEETNSDNIDHRLSVIASLGYGNYQRFYHSDGQTAIGRIALAAELLTTNQATFGLEFGLQSGNRMRVIIPQSTVDVLGCAVQSTVKPMLDLLVTANTSPLNESLLFTQFKGGIAYRYWQIHRDWIQNKSELAGEVQAGIGYPLSELTNLNLVYQGVFGGNSKITFNPLTEIGYVSNIPVQHGILLGISVIA